MSHERYSYGVLRSKIAKVGAHWFAFLMKQPIDAVRNVSRVEESRMILVILKRSLFDLDLSTGRIRGAAGRDVTRWQ